MPTRNKLQKVNMHVMTSQYETGGKKNAHLLQSKRRTLQSIIYLLEKKFIGTSSILARGKSRVLPTDPLFTHCIYQL